MSWLIVSIALAAPTPEPVPPTVDPEQQAFEEARELYNQGVELFKANDYQRAIERWKQAYRLSPRPELLQNLALGFEKKGSPDKALYYWVAFREDGPGEYTEQSDQAIARLTALHYPNDPPPTRANQVPATNLTQVAYETFSTSSDPVTTKAVKLRRPPTAVPLLAGAGLMTFGGFFLHGGRELGREATQGCGRIGVDIYCDGSAAKQLSNARTQAATGIGLMVLGSGFTIAWGANVAKHNR